MFLLLTTRSIASLQLQGCRGHSVVNHVAYGMVLVCETLKNWACCGYQLQIFCRLGLRQTRRHLLCDIGP